MHGQPTHGQTCVVGWAGQWDSGDTQWTLLGQYTAPAAPLYRRQPFQICSAADPADQPRGLIEPAEDLQLSWDAGG